MKRVPYLGNFLEVGGVRPNVTKLCNMLDWPRPDTRKKIQHYLGVINFFRKFVPNISDKLKPLLIIRDEKFDWTEEMEAAYQDIFNHLVTKGPFLHFPVPGIKLELATDASDFAIGAALYQTINPNREKTLIGLSSLHVLSLMPSILREL